MSLHYTTTRVLSRDRPAYWQEAVSRTFVPCTTTLPADFRGTVSIKEVGPISCHVVQASRHQAERTSRDIASYHKDVVLLTLVTAGIERVAQDGREAVLRKGDFAIHDSTRPYSLCFDTAFSQHIYQIPRELLRQRLGSFERYTAVRLSSDEQVGRLTSSFLLNLAQLDDSLDATMKERFTAQAVDLLAMTLSAQLGLANASRSAHRAALLYRAKSFIEGRLHTGPTAADVAGQLGCSARYVNDLFADEGMSVGNYVLLRRLERCREGLEADTQGLRRVSEIAYAWGFNSIAHFSRAFRARYGMSPSDYRARRGASTGN